jgi:hypothetical protein
MRVYVDTVACKELEFVLTLWLVKNTVVFVDTVACKELEFVLTLGPIQILGFHCIYIYTNIYY